MQAEKFLRAFPPLESLLLLLLTPCGTMRLLNYVVAMYCGDHLLVIDVDEARNLPDCKLVAPQLIGTDHVWNSVFSDYPDQKGLCSIGISVPLKQAVQQEAVFVDHSPQPVSNAINIGTDLVQKPAGTPVGFPLTQAICEERAELDTPLAYGLMTHLNTVLVEQFLHVTVT